MKSQTFVSQRGRPIKIVIDTHISFQFPNEGSREFYWIDKEDWQKDRNHWIAHMALKSWYSPAMTEFINKSLQVKVK